MTQRRHVKAGSRASCRNDKRRKWFWRTDHRGGHLDVMDAGLSLFELTILSVFVVVAAWVVFRHISSRKRISFSNVAGKPKSSIWQRTSSESARHIGKAIFISYRRSDSSDVTGRIYDRLVQHFGRENVFKDVDSIPLGVDFRSHLADSVGRCGVLLAVVGTRWMVRRAVTDDASLEDTRDFVRIEIESALEWHVPIYRFLSKARRCPGSRTCQRHCVPSHITMQSQFERIQIFIKTAPD